MPTCTRRLEFDAAHRVMRHESKCAHLHGHRYAVEVTCAADLDSVGRVIDFGVVKDVVGGWLDTAMDHATLVNAADVALRTWLTEHGQKTYVLDDNPTAEVLAQHIREHAASMLLPRGVVVTRVVVYETPNCWAEA